MFLISKQLTVRSPALLFSVEFSYFLDYVGPVVDALYSKLKFINLSSDICHNFERWRLLVLKIRLLLPPVHFSSSFMIKLKAV